MKFQGRDVLRKLAMLIRRLAVCLKQAHVALDEKSRRTTGGVIDVHGGRGLKDECHQPGDLWWREELPGALALSFGEFPKQVFIRFAQKVGFDVTQPKAMLAKGLNQGGQPIGRHYWLSS